jgi:murein L,D-transpeptidase YafK
MCDVTKILFPASEVLLVLSDRSGVLHMIRSTKRMMYWAMLICVMMLGWLAPLQAGEFPVADTVVVEKDARKLHLMHKGKVFRTFEIALGIQPAGDKKQEGDFRTPEGRYLLDTRNPNSEFFLSIHISYPNQQDRSEARLEGVQPGGAIMIHGQPNDPSRSEKYYETQDWTNGCIAVSNSDMIDIWLMTGDNTPIEIHP